MSFVVSHNPFSTRYLRPGAIPFLFDEESGELEAMIDAFKQGGYFGQVVGPHGCGKSTLCFSICESLCTEFDDFRFITIRSASNIDVKVSRGEGDGSKRSLTIIDGMEKLAALPQQMSIANLLKRESKDSLANGLIITSHRPLRFVPILYRLAPSIESLKRVVYFLDPKNSIAQEELMRIYSKAGGNIREALMLCYDRHAKICR